MNTAPAVVFPGAAERSAIVADRVSVQQPSLWYISYFGSQPAAKYAARDMHIGSGAREFTPLEVFPLTAGFGAERVAQCDVQSALYVFHEGIDSNQPLTMTIESVTSTVWRALTGGSLRRPYIWLAALALALAAGACSTYWPTLRGSAAAPAPDTYRCAVEGVRALGYRPVTFNEGDGDMDARREDRAASARLPGEQRQYNMLVINAAPAASDGGGAGSTLSVRAETIVRRFTREGWIEEGQPASRGVQAEAQQIIEQCAK